MPYIPVIVLSYMLVLCVHIIYTIETHLSVREQTFGLTLRHIEPSQYARRPFTAFRARG